MEANFNIPKEAPVDATFKLYAFITDEGTSKIAKKIQELADALNAEVQRATDEEELLRTDLNTEILDRQVADNELRDYIDQSISQEAEERTDADNELRQELAALAEKEAKDISDLDLKVDEINNSLSQRIGSLEEDVDKKYEELSKDIDSVREDVGQKYEELTEDIDSLTNIVDNNYTELRKDLDDEISAREQADLEINNRITEVVEDINANVEENVVALQQADNALQSQITTNKNDIADLTQVVQDDYTELNSAIEDLGSKVEANTTNITKEVQDRIEAVTTLQSSIEAETEARENADDSLQEQIDTLKARGRFLSLWDATTGLPESTPQISPYTYNTGDYFIVSKVGDVNYRPTGTKFIVGQASTEIETEELTVEDSYYFDGTTWHLQVNHGKTVSFENLAGNPSDNTALKNALDSKQPVGDYATKSELSEGLETKQPVIDDLDLIRSNAEAGKTAKDTIDTYGDIVTHNAEEFQVAGDFATKTELTEGLALKQDKLINGEGISISEFYPDAVPTQYVITEDISPEAPQRTLTESQARSYTPGQGEYAKSARYMPFSNVDTTRTFEATFKMCLPAGSADLAIGQALGWTRVLSEGAIGARIDNAAHTVQFRYGRRNDNWLAFGNLTYPGGSTLLYIKLTRQSSEQSLTCFAHTDVMTDWVEIGTVAYNATYFPFDFSINHTFWVYTAPGALDLTEGIVFQYTPARPKQLRITTKVDGSTITYNEDGSLKANIADLVEQVDTNTTDIGDLKLNKADKEDLPTKLSDLEDDITDILGAKLEYQNNILSLANTENEVLSSVEIKNTPTWSKLEDYLYNITYNSDQLDYEYALEYFEHNFHNLGACTSVRKGNLFGRNYDWYYSESVSFVVKKEAGAGRYASIGMAGGLPALTKEVVETGEWNNIYKVLPFYLLDGINEHGLTVSMNVVPANQKGDTTGTHPELEGDSICALMLPSYVLDKFKTAQEAVNWIVEEGKIYSPVKETNRTELHFLIADKENTFVVEFVDNEAVVIQDKNYITNFYLTDVTFDQEGKIEVTSVTPYGQGLERYNFVTDHYSAINSSNDMLNMMMDLNFTRAYNTDPLENWWKTEFVAPYADEGKSFPNLTVTSDAQEFVDCGLVDVINEKFETRTRDGETTWQTIHTSVYDLEKRQFLLLTQEQDISKVKTFQLFQSVGDGKLLIKQNGSIVGEFSANQQLNTEINIAKLTNNFSEIGGNPYDNEELASALDNKQNVIEDLTEIREGASKGATALQSIPDEYVTDEELNTKLDKKQDKFYIGNGLKEELITEGEYTYSPAFQALRDQHYNLARTEDTRGSYKWYPLGGTATADPMVDVTKPFYMEATFRFFGAVRYDYTTGLALYNISRYTYFQSRFEIGAKAVKYYVSHNDRTIVNITLTSDARIAPNDYLKMSSLWDPATNTITYKLYNITQDIVISEASGAPTASYVVNSNPHIESYGWAGEGMQCYADDIMFAVNPEPIQKLTLSCDVDGGTISFTEDGKLKTTIDVVAELATKQPVIEDLDQIRSNAQAGANLTEQVGTNTTDIGDLKLNKADKSELPVKLSDLQDDLTGVLGSELNYENSTLELLNSAGESLSSVTIKSTPDLDGRTISLNADSQLQSVGSILQSGGYQKYWQGTKAEYEAIQAKDPDTLYEVLDDIVDIVTEIPTATSTDIGLVKPDNTTITVDDTGTLSIPSSFLLSHNSSNLAHVDVFNTKANVNLNNISDNIDFVVESGTWGNGESGYKKFKSGYMTQYGKVTSSANGEVEFTLHRGYKDVNYSILAQVSELGNYFVSIYPSGNQKFKLRVQSSNGTNMSVRVSWMSVGYTN